MSARHLTAAVAVAYFHTVNAPWKPSVHMIRKWAHLGHVSRRGKDETGHTLYDVDDMIRHARKRGLLDEA